MKNTNTIRTILRAGMNPKHIWFAGITPPCGKAVVRIIKAERRIRRVLNTVGNEAYINALLAYCPFQTERQVVRSLSKWGV